MSNNRSAGDKGESVGLPAGNAWTRFWFTPIAPTGLRVLRVLSGLLFCAWILSFLGHQREFFSLDGWIDVATYQELQRQPNLAPAPIGWSILFLAGENATAFQAIYWLSVAVLVFFTLGIATRITGILTWVIVVSFLANPAISYEGDYLLGILAFYLAIGHLTIGLGPMRVFILALTSLAALFLTILCHRTLGWFGASQETSLLFSLLVIGIPYLATILTLVVIPWNDHLNVAERILGSRGDFVGAAWLFPRNSDEQPESIGANFALRMLQIHFAIIMTTSALHHLQIAEWWAGVAFWFPLHPPFQTTQDTLKDSISRPFFTLFWLSVTQYIALVWQLAFPVFAWRSGRVWRTLLLGGAATYWLGVFFLFKLPLFGPFVFLGALSFLRPDEWAAIRDRARSLFVGESKKETVPAPRKTPALAGKENIKK